jgi:hypothetical protein
MGQKSETIFLEKPLIWKISGNNTPITLPGDGILQIDMDAPGCYVLENASVLRGIHLNFRDGTDAVFDDDQDVLINIRAEAGGFFTAVHEDVGVATEEDRITCTYGKNCFIGSNKVQLWWQKEAGSWRWRVPDWAVQSASEIPYVPGDGSDWGGGGDPATLQEAVDRIAARLNTVGLLPIP